MVKSVTIAISHRALKSRVNRVLARARGGNGAPTAAAELSAIS
jgi:hypothetical protein